MNSRYLKRMLNIVLFLCLSVSLFWLGNRTLIMKREDGIVTMQNFYAQEDNTVDVLILGSSHAGTNIDLETLWNEYGYSAYALWGSSQPFWNSYHFLTEALKTQQPGVVVLDLYAASFPEEYADEARQVTNTAGMKLSLNKLQAIMATAPNERWADLLLGMPVWHSRYRELDADDFAHYPWTEGLDDFKGGSTRYGSYWAVETGRELSREITPMQAREEEYLRKIMELCQRRQIPLVLVVTPTAEREAEQGYYNAACAAAAEYDVPCYNLNTMDTETGIATDDYSIDNSHLNTQGARRVSRWLAGKLQAYGLADHRGDARYASWDRFSTASNHLYLSQITELKDWLAEISRDGYTLVVCPGDIADMTEDVRKRMSQYVYVTVEGELNGKIVSVSQNDGNVLYLNGDEVFRTREEGWFFAAYDPAVGEFVDYAMFESVNDSWMRRKGVLNLLDFQ